MATSAGGGGLGGGGVEREVGRAEKGLKATES